MAKIVDCTNIANQVLKVLADNKTPIFTVETILDIVRRSIRTQEVSYEVRDSELKAISFTKPSVESEIERYKNLIQEEDETFFEKKNS